MYERIIDLYIVWYIDILKNTGSQSFSRHFVGNSEISQPILKCFWRKKGKKAEILKFMFFYSLSSFSFEKNVELEFLALQP